MSDRASYQQAIEAKVNEIQQVADQIQRATDSGLILDLSRKLRAAAGDLRGLARAQAEAPTGADGEETTRSWRD